MKLGMYSLYDTVSERFMIPQPFRSDGEALRAFSDLCESDQKPSGIYPRDLEIHKLFDFDDVSGIVKQDHVVVASYYSIKSEKEDKKSE